MPLDKMTEDSLSMDHDTWCDEYDDDLWAEYHETGAYYDTNYEDWCEKKYDLMREESALTPTE